MSWADFAQFAGSLFGANVNRQAAADQANATRSANQQQMSLAREQMDRGEDLQREFAQFGIRWKTQDAKAAGLHPLAALGAQTFNASPVTVGANLSTDVGSEFKSRMGQDISRAIDATATIAERQYNETLRNLQLRRAQAETSIAESQAVSAHRAANPPMPRPGESITEPQRLTTHHPDHPHTLPKAVVGTQWAKIPGQGAMSVISPDLSEPLEDDFLGKLVWRGANAFVEPPVSDLPPGHTAWKMITPWTYKPMSPAEVHADAETWFRRRKINARLTKQHNLERR